MLPNRLKDLDDTRYYARYQIETLVGDKWTSGMIYACPPAKFHLLLAALKLTRTSRLKRIESTHADMALVTDTIVSPVY